MLPQTTSTLSPGNDWDIEWVIGREIKEATKPNNTAIMGDFTHLYIDRSTGTNGVKKNSF